MCTGGSADGGRGRALPVLPAALLWPGVASRPGSAALCPRAGAVVRGPAGQVHSWEGHGPCVPFACSQREQVWVRSAQLGLRVPPPSHAHPNSSHGRHTAQHAGVSSSSVHSTQAHLHAAKEKDKEEEAWRSEPKSPAGAAAPPRAPTAPAMRLRIALQGTGFTATVRFASLGIPGTVVNPLPGLNN